MKTRIVVPVVDESGMNARLSEHFGRAPYFAVVNLNENGDISSHRTVPNTSEHFGTPELPHTCKLHVDRILQLRPNALITYGMGGGALAIFQNARVPVLRANANTVEDVIAAYNFERESIAISTYFFVDPRSSQGRRIHSPRSSFLSFTRKR